MIGNPIEQQAWNDERGRRFLTPDEVVVTRHNKDWSRTHPMKCPMCHQVFYGYEPIDHPFMPYSNPHRIICGHPLCEAASEREWRKNDPHYQKTCRDYYIAKAARHEGEDQPEKKSFKLTKFGE